MKKIVLTFGLISGGIAAGMMLLTLPFLEKIGSQKGYVIGYTTIVLSALLVFFGIRSYRDNVSGGRITFGKALAIGILITLISNVCYVATWEVIYFKFMPDFADKYSAQMIERAQASGASPAEMEKKTREAHEFKEMYNKPLNNIALTFLEPFPVFLVVTLISAAILRRGAQRPT
jgi:Na+/melibiose symporter-like transporter